MEHREPTRIATSGDEPAEPVVDRGPRRRFARFVPSPSVRRLALPRLVLALLAATGVLGVLFVVGREVAVSLVAYLHGQPEYSFAFRDISLEPPPPAWFRGGKSAFLERVRARSPFPEELSILDLDLHRLRIAFQTECWVKKVGPVRRATFPNRVIVPLVYREPVALVAQKGQPDIVLDGEGVILPFDDVNWGSAGRLIPIANFYRRPWKREYGARWKTAEGSTGEPVEDRLMVAAAGLAAFLKGTLAAPENRGTFSYSFHVLVSSEVLWLQYGDSVFVWQTGPDPDPDGHLTTESRWSLLRDWIVQNRDTIHPYTRDRERIEYEIKKTGVERVGRTKNPSNQSG